MSNIITKESFTIISGKESYVLGVDEKGNPDLLYLGKSLKKGKLAKITASDLVKKLGYEKELINLDKHSDRDSAHTYKVLELLKEIINEDIK